MFWFNTITDMLREEGMYISRLCKREGNPGIILAWRGVLCRFWRVWSVLGRTRKAPVISFLRFVFCLVDRAFPFPFVVDIKSLSHYSYILLFYVDDDFRLCLMF